MIICYLITYILNFSITVLGRIFISKLDLTVKDLCEALTWSLTGPFLLICFLIFFINDHVDYILIKGR